MAVKAFGDFIKSIVRTASNPAGAQNKSSEGGLNLWDCLVVVVVVVVVAVVAVVAIVAVVVVVVVVFEVIIMVFLMKCNFHFSEFIF